MIKKNLTSRDFLRIRSSELLNSAIALTNEERWQQAVSAKTTRNFWFTASSFPFTSGVGTAVKIGAETPRFAEPVIVTDVLAMFDYKFHVDTASAMQARNQLQLKRFGSDGASNGEDLFGLTGLVAADFITKHEKNRSQAIMLTGVADPVDDTQPKWLPFVPRLLRPYDFLQAEWQYNNGTLSKEDAWMLQLGFRGVRVMQVDSPYRYILEGPATQIKNYIAAMRPETFFLEIDFPFASLPAPGVGPFVVKTPQMGRPLLILGATSNLEGVQCNLYEEGSYYRFTYLDQRPAPDEAPTTAPPLSLWCPDSDFRNTNLYNMWPVPHLLEPGAQLRLELTNGLIPTPTLPEVWQQVAKTRSSQNVKITFVCRTV